MTDKIRIKKKKENETIEKLLEVFFWLGITSVIILNYLIKKMSVYKIIKEGAVK
jgi:hypothetical protein